MDCFRLKNLSEKYEEYLNLTKHENYTQELSNPRNPAIDNFCLVGTFLEDYVGLYTELTQMYSTRQTDASLEFKTALAAYAAGEYSDAFNLAKDLVVVDKSIEVYQLLIKLCINHLDIPEFGVRFAKLGLEVHRQNTLLNFGMAIGYALLGDKAIYYTEKLSLWQKALGILKTSPSTKPDYLLYKSLLLAKCGEIQEAVVNAAEGYKLTSDHRYSALLGLLLVSKEDYTGCLKLIKRSCEANPKNQLLKAVNLVCQMKYYEIIKDKNIVNKAILSLLKASGDFEEVGSPQSPEDRSVLRPIQEESSNYESVDSRDFFTKLNCSNNYPVFKQALKLAFQAAILVENLDLAEWCAGMIEQKNYEIEILRYYREGSTQGLEHFIACEGACELLAKIHLEKGNLSSAMTLARQIIRLNEQNKSAWTILGVIYKQKEEKKKAMQCLLAALNCVNVPFGLIPFYV